VKTSYIVRLQQQICKAPGYVKTPSYIISRRQSDKADILTSESVDFCFNLFVVNATKAYWILPVFIILYSRPPEGEERT